MWAVCRWGIYVFLERQNNNQYRQTDPIGKDHSVPTGPVPVWHQHVSHPHPRCTPWSVICQSAFSFIVGSLLKYNSNKKTQISYHFWNRMPCTHTALLVKSLGNPSRMWSDGSYYSVGLRYISLSSWFSLLLTFNVCEPFSQYTYARNFHYEIYLDPVSHYLKVVERKLCYQLVMTFTAFVGVSNFNFWVHWQQEMLVPLGDAWMVM